MKDERKRDIHSLNIDGMVRCNPRDKEASHRAAMNKIYTSDDPKIITCSKCLSLFYEERHLNTV